MYDRKYKKHIEEIIATVSSTVAKKKAGFFLPFFYDQRLKPLFSRKRRSRIKPRRFNDPLDCGLPLDRLDMDALNSRRLQDLVY
jgi:hypothetical protein